MEQVAEIQLKCWNRMNMKEMTRSQFDRAMNMIGIRRQELRMAYLRKKYNRSDF